LASIYLRVWSSHPGTVASLKEEGSRLNGEIAWVMHVMGYSDLAVDTRLSNHKAQQFTRHKYSEVRCYDEGS
jgi:hypothetical protein